MRERLVTVVMSNDVLRDERWNTSMSSVLPSPSLKNNYLSLCRPHIITMVTMDNQDIRTLTTATTTGCICVFYPRTSPQVVHIPPQATSMSISPH